VISRIQPPWLWLAAQRLQFEEGAPRLSSALKRATLFASLYYRRVKRSNGFTLATDDIGTRSRAQSGDPVIAIAPDHHHQGTNVAGVPCRAR
jgi:hypothetical protein